MSSQGSKRKQMQAAIHKCNTNYAQNEYLYKECESNVELHFTLVIYVLEKNRRYIFVLSNF